MRLVFFPLLLAAGCGVDAATANGELGRMEFTLISDYYLSEHSLTDSQIVTGYEQFFGVGLSAAGEEVVGKEADEVVWRVSPDDGITLHQVGADGDSGEDDRNAEQVAGFSLLASRAGEFTVEGSVGGEVVDRITLSFGHPSALELLLHTRAPWAEAFEKVDNNGVISVSEGTQLAWLSVPLSDAADRMLGDVVADMSADPAELVVPAANVEHVNEDDVYSVFRADSLYFIEAGEVSVTLTDAENDVLGVAAFLVE